MNEVTQKKVCSKCKVEQDFYFFHKNKAAKDGLQYHCKSCKDIYHKSITRVMAERRLANKEELNTKSREYYEVNRNELLKQKKEYYNINKEKISIKQKDYRLRNLKYLSEKNKAYREKNKQKCRKTQKIYREKNKQYIAEQLKAYSMTPNGKASMKNSDHKRRAIKKQGNVTTQQLLKLQDNAKICYWCECSLKKVKIHIDHYIPLSKGGEHTLSNLVVSCPKCNQSKHSRDPIEFAQSIGRLL